MDRFNLEEAIMSVWQMENDLGLLVEQYYDAPKPMTQDEVANVLIGLKELHGLRMNKLWDTFTRCYKLDDYKEQPEKQESEWLEDGFGSIWRKCGDKGCGKFVVRPGKVDCFNGDCPERGITT